MSFKLTNYDMDNVVLFSGISFHGGRAPSGTVHPHCRSFSNTLQHTTLDRMPSDE
jgi:hypothetical protein